ISQWQNRRRLTLAHDKMKKRAASFEEEARERTNQLIQSERLAVVGQLTGGIAHDFNNLLTSILGICELQLATLPKDLEVTRDIRLIAQVGKRAANLVKKLLAFSRRQILEPQWVQPNEILNGMESMMQRLIGEQIEISMIKDRDLGTVLVDPVQLEQVILNLGVNARDAMPDGGKLIIETENVRLDRLYCHKKGFSIPPGEYVMLAFSDTGHGMPPETQSKIFEPFFTTKEKGQGTGLGLSTVYGIIKQSHGDLFVYSEPGKGTTFKIYLPREKTEADIEIQDFNQDSDRRPLATVLLVEDDDQVRQMTARLLEDRGYLVLQACDGKDALEISGNPDHRIDLLITDIIMPEMSGLELSRQFRREHPHIKILMVSGYTRAMVMQHYNLKCIPDFIQKPFTVDQIQDKVEEMLQKDVQVMPSAFVI
ncbi:MAG TPA: response regulator, partial [Desulfobacteraceae bacterium]|nr:response regulator [Desulfobacteraceae bacterium]